MNLHIDFAGITFENPFTVAASPSSDSREKVRRALEAGWGGIVFKTAALPPHTPKLAEPNMAGLSFGGIPQFALYNIDLISERQIEEIQEDIAYFKQLYPDRRFIGSIMAAGPEEWAELVARLEEAGADMIECSMSCPQGEHSIADDTKRPSSDIPAADRSLMKSTTQAIVRARRKHTPIIVKMTPNVTDIVDIGCGAVEGGADALCGIDTVRGFIGIDLETGCPKLNVRGLSTWGGLSGPAIKPIALGCVSKLTKNLPVPVAGVGGISCWQDAAEFLLLGARNTQVCTAISRHGFRMVRGMGKGLLSYMEQKGYASLDEMVGKSLPYIVDHAELSRENRLCCAINAAGCLKCGACAIACQDVGFGALRFEKGAVPKADPQLCRGCGICQSVCPKNLITLTQGHLQREG